jgi:peptide deformylase
MDKRMKIVQYPHPALRRVAVPLTAIDKKIRLWAGEMLDLMYEARGLGLAATQVSLPFQLLVVNVSGDPQQKDKEGIFLNPVIAERKGSVEGDEGCLSFPELFAKVRRAKTVKVQAYNLKGEPVEVTASDLAARALQHEIDHLNGILFIDKMGTIARLKSRSAIKDFEREYKKAQERGDIPPDADLKQMLDVLEAEVRVAPAPAPAL